MTSRSPAAPGEPVALGARPVVALRSVSKSYPGVQALRDVDLEVFPGSVHALSGENGAGKSTLGKIISGLVVPTSGEVHVDGRRVELSSPSAARRLGISAVPQELSLVPHLTVAENLSVTAFPRRNGFVTRRALASRARPVLEALGLDLDPSARLVDQSPGVQQLIMIGRAFLQDARVVILDEPTAALTEVEVQHLFEVVRAAQKRDTAFILVSHRFEDLQQIADTVTVLRDGVKVFTQPMNAVGYDDIVRAMVGRPLELFARDIHGDHARGPAASDGTLPSSAVPRLAVRNLCSAGRFDDISFDIRAGEIVGLAGLMGAGRTEIARALFGRDRYDAGAVEVDGRSRRVTSPRHAMNAGIIMVPEERKSQGLVLDRSVRDNLTIADADRVSRFGWLSRSKARAVADDLVRRLGIKAPSADTAVVTLSGGNQQKVVIGRCFLRDYSVYIFDEPTRGVDVNAKTQIYHLINELTERGAGVLLISSELPEVIAVADRVLVMKDGRITADIPSAEATEEAILSAAMA